MITLVAPTWWAGVEHTSAEAARHHGWTAGTVLSGDDEWGTETILITAVGENAVLARRLGPNGTYGPESAWTLGIRRWWRIR